MVKTFYQILLKQISDLQYEYMMVAYVKQPIDKAFCVVNMKNRNLFEPGIVTQLNARLVCKLGYKR